MLLWFPRHLSGERHLIIWQAGLKMRGSMQIPTWRSCLLRTRVTLRTEGLSAKKKGNNLRRKMGFCSWRHPQELPKMLRRWFCSAKFKRSLLLHNGCGYGFEALAWLNTEFPIKWSRYYILQAFIKTAARILQKIQEGVFDVSNEVKFYWFACLEGLINMLIKALNLSFYLYCTLWPQNVVGTQIVVSTFTNSIIKQVISRLSEYKLTRKTIWKTGIWFCCRPISAGGKLPGKEWKNLHWTMDDWVQFFWVSCRHKSDVTITFWPMKYIATSWKFIQLYVYTESV